MFSFTRYSDLIEREEQRKRLTTVQKVFNTLALEALEEGANVIELLQSAVEVQCETALGESVVVCISFFKFETNIKPRITYVYHRFIVFKYYTC